ncbi:MAG TPA: type IV toxin-antitoxin system AbiEi family antitoxin domain-containing protein [Trebonia sp.]|jgi:hypothetical protein|nr:type IV toxin-antitoxin system AbiEi family antitoxin domain-containing protein [Trebonia sp.]
MPDLEPPALRALIEKQAHVITRAQALRAGLSHHAVSHRLRAGGPWQPLLPGVYLTVTGKPTQRQRDIAAVLYGGTPAVITGLAAVRHHRMPGPETDAVDLLVPARRQCRSVSYVVVHRTTRMPKLAAGSPQASYALPARAVADAARWLTGLRDVRALVAGAVQSRSCTLDELAEELRAGPRQDSRLLRAVLAEVQDGILSVPEAELRDLIIKAKLPLPLFNPRLYLADGTFIARPDAWWPQAGVAIEVDSKRWHFWDADWERTMDRHTDLGQYSIVTLHFTPHKIRTEPQAVIAKMTNAYNSGIQRPRLPIKAVPARP